uniref:Uncharacterized protein n=1 Tax=Mycena chlorophos TaxID=658473 RepID=A0ABQ0LGC2_MYCCL|nr:predicted protein [Mycena chlorophos]
MTCSYAAAWARDGRRRSIAEAAGRPAAVAKTEERRDACTDMRTESSTGVVSRYDATELRLGPTQCGTGLGAPRVVTGLNWPRSLPEKNAAQNTLLVLLGLEHGSCANTTDRFPPYGEVSVEPR